MWTEESLLDLIVVEYVRVLSKRNPITSFLIVNEDSKKVTFGLELLHISLFRHYIVIDAITS